MAKLLETRLPIAGAEINSDTYNRMVRVLELNLGRFDPNATPQFTDAERNTLSFNAGDIIWNTSRNELEVYDGDAWISLSTGINLGLQGNASVGDVTVTLDGNVTINLTGTKYGWDIEKWYT
tara:strand:- start:9 stop:374 length:366 start_codon:yes stop_codon:yes gene_type:complete